jgi:hypothetical protein
MLICNLNAQMTFQRYSMTMRFLNREKRLKNCPIKTKKTDWLSAVSAVTLVTASDVESSGDVAASTAAGVSGTSSAATNSASVAATLVTASDAVYGGGTSVATASSAVAQLAISATDISAVPFLYASPYLLHKFAYLVSADGDAITVVSGSAVDSTVASASSATGVYALPFLYAIPTTPVYLV